MYGGHKIILHTIKRAIQSQFFIDAYCPATVTAESQGAGIHGLGLYSSGPGLAGKLLPIAASWQETRWQTVHFNGRSKNSSECQCSTVVFSKTTSLQRVYGNFDNDSAMMNLMNLYFHD